MADMSRDIALKRIYLLGCYQGGGAGQRLLRPAVEHATLAGAIRLLLGLYVGSTSALSFNWQQGFVNLTRRQSDVGGRPYNDHDLSLVLST